LNVLGTYGSQSWIELILPLCFLFSISSALNLMYHVCSYLKFPWGATLPGPSFLVSCLHSELCSYPLLLSWYCNCHREAQPVVILIVSRASFRLLIAFDFLGKPHTLGFNLVFPASPAQLPLSPGSTPFINHCWRFYSSSCFREADQLTP
jgi:hypothetical protein